MSCGVRNNDYLIFIFLIHFRQLVSILSLDFDVFEAEKLSLWSEQIWLGQSICKHLVSEVGN